MSGLTLKKKTMTERAQELMQKIWDARNSGADTEQKLVASIIRLTSEYIRFYTAQNNLIVLDSDDMIELANEVENLNETD